LEFTLLFIRLFYYGLQLTAPILVLLALSVIVLGQIAGRQESWSPAEALYWSFITATTVGYGDYRPLRGISRALAIAIAFCGVIFTGILVAIAVASTTRALEQQDDFSQTAIFIELKLA
jgi:voltage-gated potassium channel